MIFKIFDIFSDYYYFWQSFSEVYKHWDMSDDKLPEINSNQNIDQPD